jgi:beta-glucanase (GH16 family)
MTFNANNPTASGMVLTFDDEFDSASISNASGANGTKWTDHIWFHGSTPQDFQVSNGIAHILGNDPNDPWAANMETADSNGQGFSQKFGYFEADMKVTGGQGTWPAFWMYDVNKTTDPNAVNQEFDIMEGQGSVKNGYFGTIHRDTGGNDQQNPDNFINTGQDIANGFHRFGLLWDPNSPDMTFYFDGQPVKTVPKFDTTDQNPMQLILGSGFGDIGLGSNGVNGSTPIPADVQVDYVRAYQFGDQNPQAVQAEAVSPAAGNADPTALANALGQLPGSSSAGAPAVAAGSGSSTPPATGTGAGPDTLTVHVSGDPFQGDPQFTLTVDGQQIGGVQGVGASHASGAFEDVTFHGNFAGAAAADINFLNDAWGGSASQDRNLYVASITLDGHQIGGSQAMSNTADNGFVTTANGYAAVEPGVAVMDVNGTAAFNITGLGGGATSSAGSGSSTPPADTGSGPDTLTIRVSGDQFQGDPQFTLSVDGQQIGGVQSVTGVHSSGQFQDITFHGNFANAQHAVVNFTNDAWGGSASQDRNLYVAAVTLDGHSLPGDQGTGNASNGFVTTQNGYAPVEPHVAVMDVNGSLSFNLAGLAGPSGPSGAALQPSFTDIAGQDVFMFNAPLQNGAHIANFDPAHDILDLAPLLNAAGYKGTDPVRDNVVAFVPSGTDSTALMIDPTGHNPAQGSTVVTLDHILPQAASTAALMH